MTVYQLPEAANIGEFDEHAFRFMQAERDFPGINHRGTEPHLIRHTYFVRTKGAVAIYGPGRIAELRRDFERTA